MKTFTEICSAVLEHPKLAWGFIQNYHGKTIVRAHKTGGETHEKGYKIDRHYRVVLSDGKETVERSGPDLRAVIREVFGKLGFDLPEGLSE